MDSFNNLLSELYRASLRPVKEKFIPGKTPVRIGKPLLGEDDFRQFMEAVRVAFSTGWLGVGRFASQFEREFSQLYKRRYAVYVNSGSSANYLAFSALSAASGGRMKGNCITTALTFPTTINPLLQTGLKAKLLDIELPSFAVRRDAVAEAVDNWTKGVILPHILGIPHPADAVRRTCRNESLFFIEDSCDALGSRYRGKLLGTYGDIATFSFYASHHITTGEGGMLITNSGELSSTVRSFRDWGRTQIGRPLEGATSVRRLHRSGQGKLPADYDLQFVFDHKGFNMKPTDLQAALGLSQLAKLDYITRRRKENFAALSDELNDRGATGSLMLPEPISGSDVSWFCFPMLVDGGISRRKVVSHLESRRIETRPILSGNIADQPAYAPSDFSGRSKLPNTQRVAADGFFVGIHPSIGLEEIQYVARELGAVLSGSS